MELEEVRPLGLSLPGATEEPHFEMASFRVRGRIFATLPPDGAPSGALTTRLQKRAGYCSSAWRRRPQA